MTKKVTLCENKDFQIIKTECLAACCCGKAPFNSICIRKKGSLQQLIMDEEKFKSFQELFQMPLVKPAEFN